MAKLVAMAMVMAMVAGLQTAEAVDFLFWDGPACSGVVDALCTSIANGSCCVSPTAYQSVQVRAADLCQVTTVYQDSGCTANVSSNASSLCFTSDSAIFTSASWASGCINGVPIADIPVPVAAPTPAPSPAVDGSDLSPSPSEAPAPVPVSGARRLLSEPTVDCTRRVEADSEVIYYRESASKGMWSLRVSEGTSSAELLELLASVPEDEKVFWFVAQGAYYDEETEGKIRSIVHV
ncbi:hypothetical protein MPTK1_3g06340 [Marchantia polymorpha subsp. ruderalis]|nr:hypothetical protein MARPO_0006s0105 [Marchantia polymorpha]BBN04637.1 hypothetical protein Mp_3g06340 [Marchantia polymorpha subsp. ruderalis]|eukprot:PTQ48073.1 hypothetical protein MARPO_0006s0105 [Marchantia polymorpha]